MSVRWPGPVRAGKTQGHSGSAATLIVFINSSATLLRATVLTRPFLVCSSRTVPFLRSTSDHGKLNSSDLLRKPVRRSFRAFDVLFPPSSSRADRNRASSSPDRLRSRGPASLYFMTPFAGFFYRCPHWMAREKSRDNRARYLFAVAAEPFLRIAACNCIMSRVVISVSGKCPARWGRRCNYSLACIRSV